MKIIEPPILPDELIDIRITHKNHFMKGDRRSYLSDKFSVIRVTDIPFDELYELIIKTLKEKQDRE